MTNQRLPKAGEVWVHYEHGSVNDTIFVVEHVTEKCVYGFWHFQSDRPDTPNGYTMDLFLECFKPRRREIWVNEYADGTLSAPYLSLIARPTLTHGAKLIKFIEAEDQE